MEKVGSNVAEADLACPHGLGRRTARPSRRRAQGVLPASILAAGSNSIAAGDLTLTAQPVPNQFFIFVYAPARTEVPFGNGFLCVEGATVHLQPPAVASGNVATLSVNPSALGITPGVQHFQLTFRRSRLGLRPFSSWVNGGSRPCRALRWL